jgi:hypothetical protein
VEGCAPESSSVRSIDSLGKVQFSIVFSIPRTISRNASSRIFQWTTGLPFVGRACSPLSGVFCQSTGRRIMGMTRA